MTEWYFYQSQWDQFFRTFPKQLTLKFSCLSKPCSGSNGVKPLGVINCWHQQFFLKNLAPHVAMLSLWDLCLTMRSPYRTHKPKACPNSWPPVSSNTRWSGWSGVHRCTVTGSWPVQQRSLVTPRCKYHVFRPTECAAKGTASPGSFDTAQQIGLSRGIGVPYIQYNIT